MTASTSPATQAAYEHNGRPVSREAFYAIACDPARSVAVEACAFAGVMLEDASRASTEAVPSMYLDDCIFIALFLWG